MTEETIKNLRLRGWFHDRDGSECDSHRSASTLNGMRCEHRRTVHPVFVPKDEEAERP